MKDKKKKEYKDLLNFYIAAIIVTHLEIIL